MIVLRFRCHPALVEPIQLLTSLPQEPRHFNVNLFDKNLRTSFILAGKGEPFVRYTQLLHTCFKIALRCVNYEPCIYNVNDYETTEVCLTFKCCTLVQGYSRAAAAAAAIRSFLSVTTMDKRNLAT